MSDTIDRHAAIKAVCESGDAFEMIERLNSLPSAQPEIIRCKDCKHAHLTYGGDCKQCDKWLDEDGYQLTLYLDGDFYCGYAERRTDGSD